MKYSQISIMDDENNELLNSGYLTKKQIEKLLDFFEELKNEEE